MTFQVRENKGMGSLRWCVRREDAQGYGSTLAYCFLQGEAELLATGLRLLDAQEQGQAGLCPKCKGAGGTLEPGELVQHSAHSASYTGGGFKICRACSGTGREASIPMPCADCAGSGTKQAQGVHRCPVPLCGHDRFLPPENKVVEP